MEFGRKRKEDQNGKTLRVGMDVDGSSSGSEGSRNGAYDTPDILVHPAVSTTSNGVVQGPSSSSGGGGNESLSDARRIFGSLFSFNKNKKVKVSGEYICDASDVCYNMNHPARGTCAIFNHENFQEKQELTGRPGSEVDVKSIKETFTGLGFEIQEYKDFTFEQIMETLTKISGHNHTLNDCLVVFILTHGQVSHLHAYDIPYNPSSLWSMFTADKCATLAGKPKMFFIQACRGELYDAGTDLQKCHRTQVDGSSSAESSYRIPNHADFLTVYSTVEATKNELDLFTLTMQYLSLGYYAWRNTRTGSCFIQNLCQTFATYACRKDVMSMLTIVNREVALKFESNTRDPGQNKKKQIPNVCHTLMRDIYLRPKVRSTLV